MVATSPDLTGKSKVECKCSCGATVIISLKQLRFKEKRGQTVRCRSCSVKKLLINPDFKEKIRKSQQLIWEDQNSEVRKKISKRSKDLWTDSDYVQKQKEIHENEEYIESTRLASKAIWTDEFRERQRQIRSDPQWKSKQSQVLKKIYERKGHREKVASALARTFNGSFKSSLEETTALMLSSLGVKFESQKQVGPFIFDFFVLTVPLFIECQGGYWHSTARAQARDAAKFSYVSKAFPDHGVLYLHERDFLNPSCAMGKIRASLGGYDDVVATSSFLFSDVKLQKVDVKVKRKGKPPIAKLFLDSYHYAQFGRSAKTVYEARLGDDVVAVCKFSTPVRREVATSCGFKFAEVLELDRFCIHPNFHRKNFASWLVSRFVRMAFDEFSGVNCLVSFSDLTHGHIGTVYKATNWTQCGKVRPDYCYVNADGWTLHKKTLYNHAVKDSLSEREYAELHGYEKRYGSEKTKFMLVRK